MLRSHLAFVLLVASSSSLLASDPTVPAAGDPASAYQAKDYAEAARRFAAAAANGKELSVADKAAWVHCRLALAAEAVNRPICSPLTAAAVEQEVAAALAFAPDHAELQKAGQTLLALARLKAAAPADGAAVESPSFRVHYRGDRTVAEAVMKSAETKRTEAFKRWSGPPVSAWSPKCDIHLHTTEAEYATGTGHATVRLADGKATERRIDLRIDDAGCLENALPRELTHVVIADLFPFTAPPRWAATGMAVLASSPEEVGRYVRTLPRCARTGELLTVASLFDLSTDPAADKATGFYCESVSLVDYLVKLKGEAAFTLFLRGCQRYGTAKALREQYGFDSPAALEQAWKRAALDVARGQAP